MAKPLILYSTNAWLAWRIADDYYKGVHYAWCSPFFDGDTAFPHIKLPPSSSPKEMYTLMEEEVRRGDRHSTNVDRIKVGILRGAASKKAQGIITDAEEKKIASIVECSQILDYAPVLFVIPYRGVSKLIVEVPPIDRAHPLSPEFRIESLPSARFDVIRIGRV